MDQIYDRLLPKVILTILFTYISSCACAANYISAANQVGMVVVNEANGNITYCNGLFKLSNFNMMGRCRKIGIIPTESLPGNVTITLPQSTSLNKYFGSNAFIINTATGVVVMCPAFSNGSSGAQVGSCLSPMQVQ
jgi:hypothetical protein